MAKHGKGLQAWVDTLEQANELVRVAAPVDPVLEVTEVVDRVSKADGPALLFTNTGTPFPLLINSMGSYKRMAMALGVSNMDDITREIEGIFHDLTSPKQGIMEKLKMLPKLKRFADWMPKVRRGRGACQEVVMPAPDLGQLPIMHCWPHDGGRYITLPVIHTKDPLTGARNVGMYRMQVLGPTSTALHWQLHKVSRRHYEEYKRLGKRMPVAVALGGDPLYTYAATAPLPDGVDEYILAGFLRKRRVELVRCITQPDIEVPADADIVLEGYVDPTEPLVLEGPFGDHTGFYSLPDFYPRFHITAITHRRNAIYPSTIVGVPPQEDAWIGKATERIFLAPIKMTMVPEIRDMVLPMEGVFHNLALVRVQKDFPGQALKVMNTLWGAGQMMFTKMLVCIDGDVDLNDPWAVSEWVSRHTDPAQDLVLGRGPIDVLDHSCSSLAFGGKLGLDGTRKLSEETLNRAAYPDPRLLQPNEAEVRALYPDVVHLNTLPMTRGVAACLLSLRKQRPGQVRERLHELLQRPDFAAVKLLIVLDEYVDPHQLQDAVWVFANNTDVQRDHLLVRLPDGTARLGLDATRKTPELDGFRRDWPNILTMNPETVQRVDQRWPEFGLGPLLPSPSRRYWPMVHREGAVAIKAQGTLGTDAPAAMPQLEPEAVQE